MSRSRRIAPRIRALIAAVAAIAAVSLISSCADHPLAPSSDQTSIADSLGIYVVVSYYPDSIKNPPLPPDTNSVGSRGISATVVASPSVGAFSEAAAPSYTVSPIAFAPEAAATVNKGVNCEDCVMFNVPLGFNFKFFGNTYSKINISSNGIVGFGSDMSDGCCAGAVIPLNDGSSRNNLIAVAWTDLAPSSGIKYETRGTIPNRRWVLQYNANESANVGGVSMQLILYEGSNDIVMYTTSLHMAGRTHLLTQGIEDATGTEAYFVSGRVHSAFRLTNDGVKFSPPVTNYAPVVTPPPNISVTTAPPSVGGDTRIALALHLTGACAATVNPGVPTVIDDADGVTTTGARNDGLPLDAAYPKGVTTITWTATDAGGLTTTATQTVTVTDGESPSVTAPSNISARTDVGALTATVVVGEATAADNCPNVTISTSRSDNLPLSATFSIGVTTIQWIATDASGNTNSANQKITVVGNAPPVVTSPPNLAANTDPGVCAAVVNPGIATATDDAAGTTVAGVRNDGAPLTAAYPKGVTTILWTATDAEHLTSSASQTITVSDKQKPSVTPPSSVSVGNNHGLASAAVSVGSATAEDNCHEVTVSGARSDGGALGALYPVGVTTITWTATDASGNSASGTQTITVSDIEPPTIIVPADIAVNATSSSGAVVTFAVNATDNVGVTSLSCDHNSGSVFQIGYTSINCVASDAAGHTTTGTFGVDVRGAAEQLANLVKDVLSFGLMNGTTNPLINQLRSVSGTDPQSCKKMNDFISMVTKKGRDMSPEDSAYLITEATRIENVMGCSL